MTSSARSGALGKALERGWPQCGNGSGPMSPELSSELGAVSWVSLGFTGGWMGCPESSRAAMMAAVHCAFRALSPIPASVHMVFRSASFRRISLDLVAGNLIYSPKTLMTGGNDSVPGVWALEEGLENSGAVLDSGKHLWRCLRSKPVVKACLQISANVCNSIWQGEPNCLKHNRPCIGWMSLKFSLE